MEPLPDDAFPGSCCICLESLEKPGLGRQTLLCGHILHESCITAVRKKGASGRCPICRKEQADLTPVQALIDRALFYGQGRSLDKCFSLLTKAYDVDPSNGLVCHALGQMYQDGAGVGKDLVRAQELLRDACANNTALAAVDLDSALLEQGKSKSATRMLEAEWQKGNAEVGLPLGDFYADQGDCQKAISIYEAALSLEPSQQWKICAHLGILHKQKGDMRKAKEFYNRAIQAGDTGSMVNLAILHVAEGNDRAAEKFYLQAHEIGLVEATVNLAHLYERQGAIERANVLNEEARQRGDSDASFNLASTIMTHGGSMKRARWLFQEARDRGHEDAATSLAFARIEQGDVRAGRILLEEEVQRGNERAEQKMGMMLTSSAFKVHVERENPLFHQAMSVWQEGDLLLAHRLFDEAARQGDVDAVDFREVASHVLNHKSRSNYSKQELREMDADCLERLFDKQRGIDMQPFQASAANNSQSLRENIPAGNCYCIGERVMIHGLVSGVELNYHYGTVVRLPGSGERYGVKVDGTPGTKAVKPINLLAERAARPAGGDFGIGDRVMVHSLMSGVELNLRYGTIVSFTETRELYGVNVDGVEGVKSIKPMNLVLEQFAVTMNEAIFPTVTPLAAEEDIGASVGEHTVAAHNQHVNADLSQALLESRVPGLVPQVVLLTFSRSPRALRNLLVEAPELAEVREALKEHGFDSELPSGLKVFVRPEHYTPAMEAIRLAGWSLVGKHAIVDVGLVSLVEGLVRGLPGRESVRPRSADIVPLAFATTSSQMNVQITVTKTFVSITIPSSLQSSDSGAPRTKSTTDTAPYKGKNPRRSRKSRNT